MADIADVEQALVAAIAAALYPAGTSSPSAIVLANASVLDARVFAGWPPPGQLEADVWAVPPVIDVSVHGQPGLERNVTRYPQDWYDQVVNAAKITTAVSGSTITIGGAINAGDYISVVCFGQAFSYGVLDTDTLGSVAAAIGALIEVAMPCVVAGDTIEIPGRDDIIARTGSPGVLIRELERTNQRFCVTIWAPFNDARQAVARLIRTALAAIDFLTFPDTSEGRLIYESSADIDRNEKRSITCRDLYYWVEYPTTQTAVGYPITVPQTRFDTVDGTPDGSTLNINS